MMFYTVDYLTLDLERRRIQILSNPRIKIVGHKLLRECDNFIDDHLIINKRHKEYFVLLLHNESRITKEFLLSIFYTLKKNNCKIKIINWNECISNFVEMID
jgi:hypothetical protein